MFSYILVADAGQARFLRVSGPATARQVEETEKMERPSLHGDLGTTTPHATNSDFDPHAHEVDVFVKKVAHRLDELRQAGGIADFVLLAEPHFLGKLRKQLTAPTSKMVSREFSRDYTHADTKVIMKAAFDA